MTDKDRMDRAKRIREMREGSREGDSDDSTDGGEPDEPDDEPEPERTDDESVDADSADDSEPVDEADSEHDDGEPEKQTMEDLVESAAEEVAETTTDETEEVAAEEPDTDGQTGDKEVTETEAAVADLVSDAISGDSEDDTETESGANESDTEMTSTDQTDTGDDTEEMVEEELAAEPNENNGGVTAPLPDTEALEDALDEDEASEEVETVGPDMSEDGDAATAPTEDSEETESEEETRVLEFRLDDEHYCLDIEYIEEIVKEETITRVPNTPEFVQGVVDLRGQITTILNPKVALGKNNTEADQLIIVFDSEAFEDQGHIGWVVDDVRQVSPITESEVNDPPVEEAYINGVIDREDDDQFVIWTSPELAFEEAEM